MMSNGERRRGKLGRDAPICMRPGLRGAEHSVKLGRAGELGRYRLSRASAVECRYIVPFFETRDYGAP
jgi:hypothetical protein